MMDHHSSAALFFFFKDNVLLLSSLRQSCTDLCDLLSAREAVLLEVISQVQEGAPLQILAVAEDDEETLLLHTQTNTPQL